MEGIAAPKKQKEQNKAQGAAGQEGMRVRGGLLGRLSLDEARPF